MPRVLLAVLLAALAGVLSACGVRDSVDPVAKAAAKTEQAGGYKVAMSVTVSAGGRQLAMTGHGTFGRDTGELEMDLGGLMGGLGELSGGTGTSSTMKAVYVTEDGDPVVYMNLGFLSSFLPGGKSWVRLDMPPRTGPRPMPSSASSISARRPSTRSTSGSTTTATYGSTSPATTRRSAATRWR